MMKHDSSGPPVRVVLADDHQLVRSGLKALLSSIVGVEVIAEAGEGAELVALVGNLLPHLVITDLSMPGMDGMAALGEIHRRHPSIPVLVLSMSDDCHTVRRAIEGGACGYLLKGAPQFELEQAIRSVMATGSYFSPAIAQRLLQPAEPTPADELTQRQLEVLKLLAKGRAAKEIAYELGLSAKTVDVHRARIMERLNIKGVAGLTLYAVRKGLIVP